MKWLFVFLLISIRLIGQSNEEYDAFLKKYVSAEGRVNYKEMLKEKEVLERYLHEISRRPPQKDWSREAQMAYWINAYNGFTLKLILDNYPLESITDLHPFFYIPTFNTVWHKEFFQIGGEDFNLDRIEHAILREKFKDPRIHFAINCASISCPKLRNQTYRPSDLEEQLEDQAKYFINNEEKNALSFRKIEISRIFQWFLDDFKESGGLISFINRYSEIRISEDAKISYKSYNWSLNE